MKLDPKFQIVPKYVKKEQIIASLESKLSNLIKDKPILENIRHNLLKTLNNHNQIRPNLNKKQLDAIERLKNYDDIIITNADKGSKTVILNKADYNKKIHEILSDSSVYREIDHDNTNYIANKLITRIKFYKSKNYIDFAIYRQVYPDNYSIPNVYGLIKIHKETNPARIICPYHEYPLSKFAKYLSNIITPTIRKSEYSLKDSKQFCEEIRKIKLTKNDKMFSLDIVNLFTNIPLKKTIEIIEKKLINDTELGNRTNMPIKEIIQSIKFCMIHNAFSFNSKFYLQISGAPMGCNLSPIIAEALVAHIFENALDKFTYKPKFANFM